MSTIVTCTKYEDTSFDHSSTWEVDIDGQVHALRYISDDGCSTILGGAAPPAHITALQAHIDSNRIGKVRL